MEAQSPTGQRTPSSGIRLGNYELLLELASGGMATVYVARQLGAAGFERLVVVKRVHRHLLNNAAFTGMFMDEANVASRIHHPNVVPVIDVVEAERELFLVMDYVESVTLAKLRYTVSKLRQRVPPPILGRIIADTLAGLHAAHEAVDVHGAPMNVVHRDVSPQNILIGVDGMARLIDFGIAKAEHRITETRTGSLKGKYGYMSPEQTRGGDLDRRSDVFALGIVFYEVLTGHRIFHSESEYETVRRINEDPVLPPSTVVPSLPAALDPVLLRALARPLDERFPTAAAFLDALEAAMPLASHREVATYVNERLKMQLQDRRDTVRALVTGTVTPNLAESGLRASNAPPAQSLTPPSASVTHTELEISYVRGPKRRAAIYLAVAAAASVALAAFYGRKAVVGSEASSTASLSATASAPPSAEPSAATPPLVPKSDEIELVLLADRKIVGIQAQGLKRIEPDDQRARIAVLPWTGELTIDATFEGGAHGHVVAVAGGPRELLVKVDAPPPPTAHPRTGTTPPAARPLEINMAR